MGHRLLVANRGEIALRVIRACRDLGWQSIACYATDDESTSHVEAADEAWRIESEATIPYLDGEAIVALALRVRATHVHPGYGFLAENGAFALQCTDHGLIFVGPPPDAIRTMGDKVAARNAAVAAGVPILPGTLDPIASTEDAIAWAKSNGLPVALKAAAGGGGRGFRVARTIEDLPGAFTSAQSESRRAFGDDRLYVERYLERPRHVEVQIFADAHGRVVALGDRDCSIQRRHQKLLEEAPAPGLSDELRLAMAEASIKLAAAVGYTGAGTIEYLVEPDGAFWFLEMNTRIQVEHTVTEEIFGLDLVREQLLVSSGCPLSFADQPESRGHAIQMRINAEDPGRDFAPAPGLVKRFVAPSGPGVRIDSAIRSGDAISDRYDSLIAKLVVWAGDRESAIARSKRALGELIVEGVPTTAALHARILDSAAFGQGDLSTAFLSEQSSVIPAPAPPATAAEADMPDWSTRVLEVNGRRFQVRLQAGFDNGFDSPVRPRKSRARHRHAAHTGDGPSFSSPFQGSVLRIERPAGSAVEAGETIMVIEAMKMENEITAHRSGTLVAISPALGSSVRIGDPLFTIE